MTEFYRQYLSVAVLIGAAALMVGAMLGAGRLLRPNRPQSEKYITYEAGSDPVRRLRPGQRPLLHLRPALRHVRRRGGVHLPVGRRTSRPSATFGLIEMAVFIVVLALGLVYAWRKGVLRWA